MDFFEKQEQARRSSVRLVVLFSLAVLLMIISLYAVVVLAFGIAFRNADGSETIIWFQPGTLGIVALVTLGVIFLGSLYKTTELRAGGETVAAMLGGRRISTTTEDSAERQLLNVVEEMALASGIAVPPVYVLDKEHSINAFAAGFTPDDAVIGVNRGTLEYLSRDELQGVIAHEFSHILNGDMRFNIRLIGILHGILLIAIIGYYLLRTGGLGRSGRDKGGGQIMLLGLAAIVIGSVGLIFGRLIKAGVSRQREYLADASAVQFTRNPDGISGALIKIGGIPEHAKMETPEAESASHMFFGSAFRRSAHSPFATHPPLAERIKCIDPSFDGKFPPIKPVRKRVDPTKPPVQKPPATAADRFGLGGPFKVLGDTIPLDPILLLGAVGAPTMEHVAYSKQLIAALPPLISESIREPFSARCVVFAMLLDNDRKMRDKQLRMLAVQEGEPTRDLAIKLTHHMADLAGAGRLPVIEIILGTLRQMSTPQYERFRETVMSLVMADDKVTLFEFILQRVLLKHLDRAFFKPKPPVVRYHSINPVVQDLAVLISAMAYIGHPEQGEANRVFQQAIGTLRLTSTPPPICSPSECSLERIDKALTNIGQCSPAVKKRVITCATLSVAADGEVTVGEAELLRAVADSLDCPIPPIIAGKLKAAESA